MDIIPVIYIRDGKCVSFYKGDQNQVMVYPKSPKSYAKIFAAKGAKYIQVVDKDGVNWEIIKEIIDNVPIKIQLAAKIRNIQFVEKLFEVGVARIIIGVAGRSILKEASARFGPDKIFAGIKGKNRKIITSEEIGEMEVVEYAEKLGLSGVKNVIYHDVWSEGTMIHPNYDEVERIINFTDLNVYASGGIADEKHLELLEDTGVKGALIGKAFYEHKLNFEELLS